MATDLRRPILMERRSSLASVQIARSGGERRGSLAVSILPLPASPRRTSSPAVSVPTGRKRRNSIAEEFTFLLNPVAQGIVSEPEPKEYVKSKAQVDRSGWRERALAESPDIKELTERIDPLQRALSFIRLYQPGTNAVKLALTRETILQLIMQHLKCSEYRNSFRTLQKESGISYQDPPMKDSRLVTFMRKGLKATERLYDLVIADKWKEKTKRRKRKAALSSEAAASSSGEAAATGSDSTGIPASASGSSLSSSGTFTTTPTKEKSDTELGDGSENGEDGSLSPAIFLEEQLFHMGLLLDDDGQDSVNIWEEPEEGNVIRDPKPDGTTAIRAASLNHLVVHLTSGEEGVATSFTKTFLMTYQSFVTPPVLLRKLIQRFVGPPQATSQSAAAAASASPVSGSAACAKWTPTVARVIELRVINVLKQWIADYWEDFDDGMRQTLKEFIEDMKANGNAKLAGQLEGAVKKATKERADNEAKQKQLLLYYGMATVATSGSSGMVGVKPPPEPKVPANIFSTKLSIYDIDEEELARQLTLIEFDIYSKIKPAELLNQAWSKPKLRAKAPNVLKMIGRFNDVSQWVATLIVTTEKVRTRAKLMLKFIRIATHLKELNNFATLMAIIAGLNFSSIHRLKWTRKEMEKLGGRTGRGAGPAEQLKELERIMSSESSFKVYRETLATSDPPCIPYLGVYLTDLVFIDENPNKIQGLINFTKRKLIYNVISKVQQYQLLPYNLQPVYQIMAFLMKLPTFDEQEIYRLSLLREPRGADRNAIL